MRNGSFAVLSRPTIASAAFKYNKISLESAGVRGISRILFPFPLTVMILRLKSMLPIFNEINSARRMPVSYSVLIIMRLSLLEYKSEASL